MEEDSGLVQPIWTMSLIEIAKCDFSGDRKEEETENVTIPQANVEVLVDLVKNRLQDQGCELSLRSVHLAVPRSGFVAGGYNPCLN